VQTTWTANVDISDQFGSSLFGSITADIGFSFSYSETVTSSIAQAISNSCPGEGTLYYQPLSTYIQGDFTDDTGVSPKIPNVLRALVTQIKSFPRMLTGHHLQYVHSNVEIWIPQTSDSGLEQGQYKVQCQN
jgi:hypothetical protein